MSRSVIRFGSTRADTHTHTNTELVRYKISNPFFPLFLGSDKTSLSFCSSTGTTGYSSNQLSYTMTTSYLLFVPRRSQGWDVPVNYLQTLQSEVLSNHLLSKSYSGSNLITYYDDTKLTHWERHL